MGANVSPKGLPGYEGLKGCELMLGVKMRPGADVVVVVSLI